MEEMEEILGIKKTYTSDRLKFIGVKEFLKVRVAQMAQNNIKVRLHACGNGAVRLAPNAFEYAREKYGERLLLNESLRAYTLGAAYAAGTERAVESLEIGKLADIAVLEKNVFECASSREEMFNMQVLITILDGEILYSK